MNLPTEVRDQLCFDFISPSRHPGLEITPRQLECLAWAQEGKSATDIGAILGISPRTVENHFANACEQLGVRTRIQAVVKARDLGILGRPTE